MESFSFKAETCSAFTSEVTFSLAHSHRPRSSLLPVLMQPFLVGEVAKSLDLITPKDWLGRTQSNFSSCVGFFEIRF